MKIKIVLMLVGVLILTGCSNFRETSVSEDGEVRRIMTDNTGEVEIPANPESLVLLRPVDVLNAHLLDGNITAVTSSVENNRFVDEYLHDTEFIEYEDFEDVKGANPDLIVTSSQDTNINKYDEVAPTLGLNYSEEFFNTYRNRIYLIQLNKMGVILGESEKASDLANDWMERMTEHRRELTFDPGQMEATVLVEGDEGFYIYNEFSAYGTEVMYDVLNFNVAEDASGMIRDAPFNQYQVSELQGLETDYILVNKRPDTDEDNLAEELSETLNVQSEQIVIVEANDFITNDLISLEGQTKMILEHLE